MARQTVPNSGLWSSIAALHNANYTELYDSVQAGVYDYNDLATQTTPINVPTPGTFVALTNDAAGGFTNTTYALPGVPNLWIVGTQRFDWTSLVLGDTVDIRLDLKITTTSLNQTVDVSLFLAAGTGGEYQIPWIIEKPFKATGERQLMEFNSVYMGDTNTISNPAVFKIKSDAALTVKVNGWYIRAIKRKAT